MTLIEAMQAEIAARKVATQERADAEAQRDALASTNAQQAQQLIDLQGQLDTANKQIADAVALAQADLNPPSAAPAQ